jgi:hypothetical protein
MDAELRRLEDEMVAARAAVADHVRSAVLVWRGDAPPSEAIEVVTPAWMDRYNQLRGERDHAESAVLNYLRGAPPD